MLESVVEAASGSNDNVPASFPSQADPNNVPDDQIPFSEHNWNRPLGYGTEFDEVQLYRVGVSPIVPGSRFYSNSANRLYDTPILKLHGSINWFSYEMTDASGRRSTKYLLYEGAWRFNSTPTLDSRVLEPILVAPVIGKAPPSGPLMRRIWARATRELQDCKRIIVAGYSFPAADSDMRKLLQQAFAGRPPQELYVVNPDHAVSGAVEALCGCLGKARTFDSVEELVVSSGLP